MRGTLAHTWSLSVEEQFYLLWPLLLLVAFRLARGRARTLVVIVLGVWILAWVYALIAAFVGTSFDLLNNATHFRATELLAGCLLAIFAAQGHLRPLIKRPRLASLLGLIALGGLIGLIAFGEASSNGALIMTWFAVSVCTAVLIASLQGPNPTLVGRLLSLKPIVALGIASYGIYLWHFPIMVSIDALAGLDSAAAKIVSVVLTAAAVVASYYLIERPFLRLKDRIGKHRKDSRVPRPSQDATEAPSP